MQSKALFAPTASLFGAWLASSLCLAAGLPAIPVGFDAYRQWEQWPQQRIGMRAYMRSTYDRRGGNEGADASHFLYQRADDFNVTLDLEGPGILCFARYNHWHGSPWHYVVDGHDFIIGETSTPSPDHPVQNSVFMPAKAFPAPLAWTWAMTQGADLSWVPVPFERSFTMAYSRTHYGTGYYIYDQFVPGVPLSQPLHSWNPTNPPPSDVLSLLARAGDDLLPPAGTPECLRQNLTELDGTASLSPGETNAFLPSSRGPATIRALEFEVPKDQAIDFGRARLRITWDARSAPSIDAPVALFFGTGTLYDRDQHEFLVRGFPINVRYQTNTARLACYFPMPFFRSARFELVCADKPVTGIHWWVQTQPFVGSPSLSTYFHATYRDIPKPERGQDMVLLDTRETEGGGDWSGHFVGNSWIFSDRANLATLEGDPRFFFDDSLTPQAQGTGTEEWGGGGDYWGGRNMTLPFAGHPVGARNEKEALNAEDQIESAYRFLLGDLMPFGRNALIRLEHGGENQSTEHYQAVSYWYGLPSAALTKTDELQLGDTASETAHHYQAPSASEPYTIISRYEWGVDRRGDTEFYPAHADHGRTHTKTSEFTLKLDPRNVGVLLRRKLDYQFPDQRAEISVADGARRSPSWRKAGIWYLAGGNTCVYSNPRTELGATEHEVQTSNRRFRDDEFLVPMALTQGLGSLRVRVRFTPVPRPLVPGQSLPELAWSEIKYSAYCYLVPNFALP